jgi:2-C-methyl-D-erythritol 2,4-cyclodiphosphate synthase
MFRVGIGQDSHRFLKGSEKKLVLGGVEVSDKNGFECSSDGDVIIHALCRAIEQALGGESFSTYADKMCREGIMDSREYLKVTVKRAENKGYVINNIGISVEAKYPKIDPIAEEMKRVLSEILKIQVDQIGVNATSGEDLTAFGRGEGVQASAIISLIKE